MVLSDYAPIKWVGATKMEMLTNDIIFFKYWFVWDGLDFKYNHIRQRYERSGTNEIVICLKLST